MSKTTEPKTTDVIRLAAAIRVLIRELLVAGRAGKPAEGLIPFNPLYFHFLGNLLEEETLSPSDLAQRLGVVRSTLSTASKALQRRGLLQTEKDPDDGRGKLLRLTAEGIRVAQAIRRQDEENMRVLLSQLDTNERTQILDVLEKLVVKLD